MSETDRAYSKRSERGVATLMTVLGISLLVLIASLSTLLLLNTQLRFRDYQYLFSQGIYTSESAIVEIENSKIDSAFVDLYALDFYSGDLVRDSDHYVGKFNWDSGDSSLVSITYNRDKQFELYLRFSWDGTDFREWNPQKLTRVYTW